MGWQNGANSLLILSAETVGFSGLFAYSPQPAAGNLKFSISVVDGIDPYSNHYSAGYGTYTGNAATDIFLALTDGGIIYGLNQDLPTGTGALAIVNGDTMRIQRVLLATTPGGTTAETWHTPLLANSWAAVSGSQGLQYRLTPENEVQLSASLTAPASPNAQITTLPAGYRPATDHHGFAVAVNALSTTVPRINLDSSGNLTIAGVAAAGDTVTFEGRIPLDI